MQRLTPCKIQHFTSCSFTVFNKLKALQLNTVGLWAIKHQHSKKLTSWIEATWAKNTWKMQVVCKSLFTKGVQNVHHLHGHMPGHAFFSGQTAVSIMTCQKSGHIAIKHSFSSLRTVNEQKQNVGILHGLNLYSYFHDIWQTSIG